MNGIIVINKEKGYTSHDVVAKLRGILRVKKIGHTGTLDPDATGVLPVCIGNATKVCDLIMDRRKEYTAGVKLGVVTDTQDIGGNVIAVNPVSVTLTQLLAAAQSLTGEILQETPMYSARKINGQKLIDLARKGITVEREKKPITIESIEIFDYLPEEGTFSMHVRCSKGTYIRTLCHDIGQLLGCGACMTSLIRTASAEFTLEEAHTLAEVEEYRNSGRLPEIIKEADSLFPEYGKARIKSAVLPLIKNGNMLPREALILDDENAVKVRVYNGYSFMALYEWSGKFILFSPVKMFLPDKMEYFSSLDDYNGKRCAVMLGKFDGMHIGHRAILNKLMEMKKNLPAVVLEIDSPKMDGNVLVTSSEKHSLYEQLEINSCIHVPFESIRELSPEDFVRILKQKCKVEIVCAGEDFRFGFQRSGDANMLVSLCEKYGIQAYIVKQVCCDGQVVSSTYIRNLIANGRTEEASVLLDSPYRITGITMQGRQLGRTIGFPTLNLVPSSDKMLPPDGVYETETMINGLIYPSITNIGCNPSVDEASERTVETHLFELPPEGIGYSEYIEVYFGRQIRKEMKFSSLTELKEQIQKDCEIAKNRIKPIYKA